MMALVCADIVLHDQHSLYEQIWKSHPLCILLNMFSYALMLVSIFVVLLIAYMRMIACVYPFKLSSISALGPICTIIIFLCVSFSVSYITYSGIMGSHTNSHPQLVLGFGLILPIRMHGQSMWSLLSYVIPVVIMLCVSSAFQLACIRALISRSESLNQSSRVLLDRRRSVARCIATLVLTLCCQLPLLLLHVASIFGIVFLPHVSMAVTVLTLYVYSVASCVLYVGITPDFISYILPQKRQI